MAAEASRDLSGYLPADARSATIHYGSPVSAAKAAVDSLYIMGGPARNDGKFQDNTGTIGDDEGWYGVDLTLSTVTRWQVGTNNNPGTGNGAWCGELLDSCGGADPAWGYGNGYNELLDFYWVVPSISLPTDVEITALLNYDVEPGYDYVRLQVETAGGMSNIVAPFTGANYDTNGVFQPVNISASFQVPTTDYVGGSGNQIHLRWEVTSDSAWSDADCLWPTAGAATIDNVVVKFNTVTVSTSTFESGLGDWIAVLPPSVGDFSKVWWPRLQDIDPCNENKTPVFSFIDDGVVVPGTGGTLGSTWTYGPSGFTHNLLGGLVGPAAHMNNEIWSPVVTWPAGYDGALFSFDVYRHLPLANGMFYVWHVQSSTDGGATWGTGWQDDNFVYYSNTADWLRVVNNVTAKMQPGRNAVQMALGANEYGWVWGYEGTDGTPSPYFDNVQFVVFTYEGPGMETRDIDVFNDGFPAIGVIDYGNLAANSVRLDMARDIAVPAAAPLDFGDSIYVDVKAVRTGSVLNSLPEMHVRIKANPLFDTVRTLPPGFTQTGSFIDGVVVGDTTFNAAGFPIPDRFDWDLPDAGFFFPGDVMHYFFRGEDNVGGNVGVSLLPGDTTGFSVFPGMAGYVPLRYPSTWIVRALPTMTGATVNDQPKVLFWNDFANRGGENEWITSLSQLGYVEGIDYDIYYTNGPSSGVSNGLGGKATAPQLSGYRTLLYTSGDLGSYTISNGLAADKGNDVSVLDTWLQQGGKNAYFTGDDVEWDLNRSGATAVAFRNTWFSVTQTSGDVRPLIGNQATPKVLPLPQAVGDFQLGYSFVAFGGCQIFNDFDAVVVAGTAKRVAEFANPAGAGGAYTYAAMVYNNVVASTAKVIYQPFDFMYIYDTFTGAPGTVPVRTKVLEQILLFFGEQGNSPITDVPTATFAARNYPNPFNPSTKIEYSLPRAGELSIRIYNVRGELVRTLFDGRVEQPTGSVEWDGTDGSGKSVASGVYFYQLQSSDKSIFQKMTMVK
jgi:hypothetical protein